MRSSVPPSRFDAIFHSQELRSEQILCLSSIDIELASFGLEIRSTFQQIGNKMQENHSPCIPEVATNDDQLIRGGFMFKTFTYV